VIDPRTALGLWDIAPPASIEPMGGTNNRSWRVETAGGAYILRAHQNEGNLAHVSYEHVLLARLARRGLSFRVPVPLPSRAGRTLQPISGDEASTTYLSLFPVIPGRHPQAGSVDEARTAGAAVGELDAALAPFSLDPGDPVVLTHAHLDRIHPLVPSALDAIRELETAEELRAPFGRMVERAQCTAAGMYALLPLQIVHNDIARSNMLIEEGLVTGVLDFEFAGPDLRILDLAVGVLTFGADWSAGSFRFDLALVAAFAGGYGAWVRPTPEEVEAIPDVLRLRSAVSVIHRLGRYRAGLAVLDDVTSRMREGLRMDAWLDEHRAELLHAVAAAM
jgi:homoserine kinase type II